MTLSFRVWMTSRLAGLAVAVSMTVVGCGESGTRVTRPVPNLIANGSFEHDGQPTLDGWHVGRPAGVELVPVAPPSGGAWSLKLTADWAPTSSFVFCSVPSCRNGDVVILKARVRAFGPFGGGGSIGLVVAPTVPFGLGAGASSASATDSLWTELKVVEKLTMSPGDSLWVVLSAFHTEIIPYQGLFDTVSLTRRRSLTASVGGRRG